MDSLNPMMTTNEGLRELCGRGMSTTSEVAENSDLGRLAQEELSGELVGKRGECLRVIRYGD